MSNKTNPIETARKRLETAAKEIAQKLGIEIHSVHFSTIEEEDLTPRISARLCYTDTTGEQVITKRE